MADRRALVRACLSAVAFAVAAGCVVRVYQPMSGLHRPVVVDPRLPNFQDVRLTVRCVPQDLLNAAEAGALCQKVGLLFENQGAIVNTISTSNASDTGSRDTGADGDADASEPDPTDLTLVLRARQLHHANNLLSWVICLSSFTVIPAVSESTFAQDVEIRDETGFLLVSESLEGRLVERFGVGTWLGNSILDATVRDDEDKLMGDAVKRDVSADLYRQLSQLVFNAKMMAQIPDRSAQERPAAPAPAPQGVSGRGEGPPSTPTPPQTPPSNQEAR